uniref:Protein arginine N-methyltransferase n=1 Tax=Rhizophora mucronata TaxID=61149 RepID=A0A2P2MNZ9_RHIMU
MIFNNNTNERHQRPSLYCNHKDKFHGQLVTGEHEGANFCQCFSVGWVKLVKKSHKIYGMKN